MPARYQVNVTTRANADLRSIFDHIAKDSPERAKLVIRRLLDAIQNLETMPARFRSVGRSRKHGRGVHARVVAPFIVYYRIAEKRKVVFVTEVRHGARRQPRGFE